MQAAKPAACADTALGRMTHQLHAGLQGSNGCGLAKRLTCRPFSPGAAQPHAVLHALCNEHVSRCRHVARGRHKRPTVRGKRPNTPYTLAAFFRGTHAFSAHGHRGLRFQKVNMGTEEGRTARRGRGCRGNRRKDDYRSLHSGFERKYKRTMGRQEAETIIWSKETSSTRKCVYYLRRGAAEMCCAEATCAAVTTLHTWPFFKRPQWRQRYGNLHTRLRLGRSVADACAEGRL